MYIYTIQWRIQDFPEEGAPTPRGGRQHTILPHFPKNCMKLKEFGPPGGGARPSRPPLDPPLLFTMRKTNKSIRNATCFALIYWNNLL